jgi:hypothetical protein
MPVGKSQVAPYPLIGPRHRHIEQAAAAHRLRKEIF